VIVISTT